MTIHDQRPFLSTDQEIVQDIISCFFFFDYKLTIFPSIWLIAALSLSMCSATTLLLCSLMNIMKAFNGFLTWDMSGPLWLLLLLFGLWWLLWLLLFCDWGWFLVLLLELFWLTAFTRLWLWLTWPWCPLTSDWDLLLMWSWMMEAVVAEELTGDPVMIRRWWLLLWFTLDEEEEELEVEWLPLLSKESTLWLKLEPWTLGLTSGWGRGDVTIDDADEKGPARRDDEVGGGVAWVDDRGDGYEARGDALCDRGEYEWREWCPLTIDALMAAINWSWVDFWWERYWGSAGCPRGWPEWARGGGGYGGIRLCCVFRWKAAVKSPGWWEYAWLMGYNEGDIEEVLHDWKGGVSSRKLGYERICIVQ